MSHTQSVFYTIGQDPWGLVLILFAVSSVLVVSGAFLHEKFLTPKPPVSNTRDWFDNIDKFREDL